MQSSAIFNTVEHCSPRESEDSIVSETSQSSGRVNHERTSPKSVFIRHLRARFSSLNVGGRLATRDKDSSLHAPETSNSSSSAAASSQIMEPHVNANNRDLVNKVGDSMKCQEASSSYCDTSSTHEEKLKPMIRDSTRRLCSRCSSLLSMEVDTAEPPEVYCKLCLSEVPYSDAIEIALCGCSFCIDCIKMYIKFQIQIGAYEISCPDAQCKKQGVISLWEIEALVSDELMKQHKRFRFNREVDLDVTRMWCPRAGCGTVCNVCESTQQELPQRIQCPTCSLKFCSNCKNPWHSGLTCKDNSKKLAKLGQLDLIEMFDPDVIKRCPVCSVPIERDDGCAQIMCRQCNHVFCWYCLASLDHDFFLRHFDTGSCKNKLGHSRISTIWYRVQVATIFAGFGVLVLLASPCFLLTVPCLIFAKCRNCRERENGK